MFVRQFICDFGFDEVFHQPFCDEGWFSVFFGFVNKFVGHVAVREHFVHGHQSPFWERVFCERVDSFDEMRSIGLVEDIFHSFFIV
ncbi:hypothetical protein D3C86_1620670 [compost metagenome]